jgi:hypothetical protein
MKKQLNLQTKKRDKEFNDAADLVGSATGFMVFLSSVLHCANIKNK